MFIHQLSSTTPSSFTLDTISKSPFAPSLYIYTWLSPPDTANIFPILLQLTFQAGTPYPRLISLTMSHLSCAASLLHTLTLESSEQLAMVSCKRPMLLHQATSRTQSLCSPRTWARHEPSPLKVQTFTLLSRPPETKRLGGS